MAPEIEVPPPNSFRGVCSMSLAAEATEASSLRCVQGSTSACRNGPVHCIIASAIDCVPPERIAPSTRGLRSAAT